MSMNWTIHICNVDRETSRQLGMYVCEIKFELDSWLLGFGNLIF